MGVLVLAQVFSRGHAPRMEVEQYIAKRCEQPPEQEGHSQRPLSRRGLLQRVCLQGERRCTRTFERRELESPLA